MWPGWYQADEQLSRASIGVWVTRAKTMGTRTRVRLFASLLRDSWHLSRLIATTRPDVVLTNTIVSPIGAIAAKLRGVDHAWYIHEFGDIEPGLTFCFGRAFSLWIIRKFSAMLIFNSKAVMAHFPELGLADTRLLHPPAKALSFGLEHKVNGLQLLLVGGLSPAKRQDQAIRAVALLRKDGIPASLMIAGAGYKEYELYLRDLIEELGLGDSVAMMGHVEDPSSCYARASVALMCSPNEAFGRVTVEAMTAGLPVVAARSGGTVDLVQNGYNGLLYEPDDVDDLAEKIRALYLNPCLRRTLGANARSWSSSRFSHEVFGDTLFGLLRSVAARGMSTS